MKYRIIISAIVLWTASCSEPKYGKGVTVLPAIKDSFTTALQYVDSADRLSGISSEMSAILVPRAMGDIDEEFFASDPPEGIMMPCQCAFAGDSLVVLSALAYEGGFAYLSEVTKAGVKNKLRLFGKKAKWKFEKGEWLKNIEVPSAINNVVLSAYPPAMNQTLYGLFEVETIPYFEREGNTAKEQKHKLKIYFNCKVYPTTF